MKLVVPLMMPAIHSMRLAVRPSRSALMMGMPPATAASKATTTPRSRGRGEDLAAVHGQQRLVGGDHMLAGGDGLEHQRARDAVAADQLDHDVDRRLGDHRARIGHHPHALARRRARARSTSRSATIAISIAAPGAAPDLLAVALQHAEGAAADGADAEQADLDGLHGRIGG
jgi:hypothetical protein